ncbi:MAG: VCBS repeat-containing protein [Bacteroidales bacterium]|nr:VCBS repeat-containing protein [Bacteroidales bacterium]
MKLKSKILFIVLLSSFVLIASKKLYRSEYFLSIHANSMRITDIELDGDNDIVIEHGTLFKDKFYTSENVAITIVENTGYGDFIIKNEKTFDHLTIGILTMPVNSDNYNDIITTHNSKIRVYFNDGEGNFNEYEHFDLNNEARMTDIANGDINGDGLQDIVIISQDDQIWGILYNDGNGGFTEPEYYQLGTPLTGVACGDINGDGRDDIVVGGFYTNVFFSYESGFEWQEYAFMFREFYIMDFDNDGDNDIICQRWFLTQRLGIFENKGGQNLEIHYYQFEEFSGQLSCSDLNGDSLPELIFSSDPIRIYRNLGSYELSEPIEFEIETHGGGPSIYGGDMEGNGYNDLVVLIDKLEIIPNLYIYFHDGMYDFFEYPTIKIQNYLSLPGYHFHSSRILPFDPNMTSILDTIMNGELGFVRNSQGEMLQKVGDEWVNGIGDWQTTEGYLFYLNDTANFDIVGTYIDPQTPIALEEGYQFISFLPGQPMNAMQAFYEVLYSLEFVRNSEGEMLMLIGNEWVNNIGDMQPKEGYLVKMYTGDTLVYPD